MGSLKFCRELGDITLHAIHVEMIIKIREGLFQVLVYSQPCFTIDGFRDRSAELIIIAEKGFCLLKIPSLDGIQQGLYDFSLIHHIFPLLLMELLQSKWAWVVMDAPSGTSSISPK